ncbi:MAG: arginine deiminase family protein [Desulfobacterales bacterium]|jgi:dimethylargininase
MFAYALTRKPGRNFSQGLTTSNLGPPNYELILKQHASYVDALKTIGVDVIELDPLPDYPDAHFVEDTAVVMPEVAVITRPGAASRQGEEESIADVLKQYREVEYIQNPGALDGGDVLMIGNRFFIGISERTNLEGAEQLGRILEKYGKTWTSIQVGAGLHFKSSVNYSGKNSILVTQDFANHETLNEYDKLVVDRQEEYSANCLWINDHLLMPSGFPNTKAKLKSLRLPIIELDVSEMQKMDGGLTCLSLRF